METANHLSQSAGFEPHGQCFLWNADLVLLHAISDSVTTLAYFSIPVALLYFVRKRQDLPYKWMFVLFSTFFVTCGATHLLAVWTIWKPDYWLEGAMKGVNAAVSLVAAGLLWPMIPRLLQLPSPAQLATANQELQDKIAAHKLSEAELSRSRQHLEKLVQERTTELVQANQALRADVSKRLRTEKTLQLFRTLLDHVHDSLEVIDPHTGRFLDVNEQSCLEHGYARDELLSMTVPDIDPIVNRSAFDLIVSKLRTTPSLTLESFHRRKDGTTFPVEIKAKLVRAEQEYVVAVVRDITERKRAEEVLRESEARYRLLFDNMLNGFAYCRMQYDDHGRPVDFVFLSVNDSFERLTGLKNAVGKPISELTPGIREISPEIFEIYGRVASTGLPETVEFNFKSNKQWLTISVYSPEKGNFAAVFEDITKRKQAEEALMEANAHNRNLIEASLDPLVAIGPDGRITDVNMASEALTGLPRERLIGSDFWTFFTEPDKAREGYLQVLVQGAVRDHPLTVRHASGRLTDVLYNATVYCDSNGAVQGVLATARDMTERKRMEEQASKMERLAALGQMLGGIAHEIKNPLFIVTGHLQLMKERLANREYDTLGADIQSIEEASKRMTEITQRFLSLSRPATPNWQQCSVHDILAKILSFLANELMKSSIQVIRDFAPDIPLIWSEPRQLYEVFLNLILNAMQAMTAAHGRGTLTITTSSTDDSIMVRIQDDGPGIPLRYHARLFEPFFSTKPADQGTGLGLWTVRSMMAVMDGTVTCESVEGEGATFIVRIPIVSHLPKE